MASGPGSRYSSAMGIGSKAGDAHLLNITWLIPPGKQVSCTKLRDGVEFFVSVSLKVNYVRCNNVTGGFELMLSFTRQQDAEVVNQMLQDQVGQYYLTDIPCGSSVRYVLNGQLSAAFSCADKPALCCRPPPASSRSPPPRNGVLRISVTMPYTPAINHCSTFEQAYLAVLQLSGKVHFNTTCSSEDGHMVTSTMFTNRADANALAGILAARPNSYLSVVGLPCGSSVTLFVDDQVHSMTDCSGASALCCNPSSGANPGMWVGGICCIS